MNQHSPIKRPVLDHPIEDPPTYGDPTEIADGVFWLRMPLPFRLDHINLWLLRDGDDWTLVDTGLNRPETRALWPKILENLPEDGRIARIIVTHFHPDHAGLAGWLCARTGAKLIMTQGEWMTARLAQLSAADPARAEERRNFFRSHQAGADLMEALPRFFDGYDQDVTPLPTRYHAIDDGYFLEIDSGHWLVMIGRGHAPELACLYSEEKSVLISSDQILPRITTHMGVWESQPDANPLADYLDSVGRLATLPADTLVLPSHGLPFRGLRKRADYIEQHHDERLSEIFDACNTPTSAGGLLPKLFDRPLDGIQKILALSEIIAHLNYLVDDMHLVQSQSPDGHILYEQAP